MNIFFRYSLPFFFSAFLHPLSAQEQLIILTIKDGMLEGSLRMPAAANKSKPPLVIFISGSGPTDRDGNIGEMKNNCFRLLADTLATLGVASFRFDKRGVGESTRNITERDLRLEHFADDVRKWISLLHKDGHFSSIIVAGHSEGSLLGILAAQSNTMVNGYISLAGAGRNIYEVLREQLAYISPEPRKIIYGMLDKLRAGDTIPVVPPLLYFLFRPSVQPFLISWMKYDPAAEIKKLKVPALIVGGTTDIQVPVRDARLLDSAAADARLVLIENMNHVLKECAVLERKVQMATYENPDLPLAPGLVQAFMEFLSPFLK